MVNNAAVHEGALGSARVPVLSYFQYIVSGGIARRYGNSMFNFLKNDQAAGVFHGAFHSGCTS